MLPREFVANPACFCSLLTQREGCTTGNGAESWDMGGSRHWDGFSARSRLGLLNLGWRRVGCVGDLEESGQERVDKNSSSLSQIKAGVIKGSWQGAGSMWMDARFQQHLLGAENLCGFSSDWTDHGRKVRAGIKGKDGSVLATARCSERCPCAPFAPSFAQEFHQRCSI